MKRGRKWGMLAVIMMFWFTISFITNILGPLIPDIVDNYQLENLALASFIPTSFFIAYAVMSVPAGILVDRYGEKFVLFTGFLLPFVGTLLFACIPVYRMLLASAFIVGIGMAMLQTVLNPLQRAVGGEENYAFVAEFAQFVFGVASFISPWVYSYLIRNLKTMPDCNFFVSALSGLTPPHLPWVSLYWVFSLLLLLMIVLVAVVHFPKIELKEDERSGSSKTYLNLFRQKYVWLFFLGIFSYVSTEQGISIYMSTFLQQYHGVDAQTVGAECVSYFWGSMTIGCLFGMVLLKLLDSRLLLKGSGFLSMLLLALALFGGRDISVWAFPALGFSISMIYSIVFSLALNTVDQNHGSFAGILCSAIVGGAVGPLVIGVLTDYSSLRVGMSLIFLFVAYITFIGFWAKPLVNNKTWSWKRIFQFNK